MKLRGMKKQRGSSLIEVLLTLAVMLLLAATAVICFSSRYHRASLEEGVLRLEGVLRFARAEAANSGHKVQIQFELVGGSNSQCSVYQPKITSEKDPVNAPGVFSEMPDVSWMENSLADLVQVESVKSADPFVADMTDPEEPDELVSTSEHTDVAESVTPQSITFYPDGSSDSADIVLVSSDTEDERKIELKLAGLTGDIDQEPFGVAGSENADVDAAASAPIPANKGNTQALLTE